MTKRVVKNQGTSPAVCVPATLMNGAKLKTQQRTCMPRTGGSEWNPLRRPTH